MSEGTAREWVLAWRLAVRELRAGTRGFRVLMACLALGVFAMAAAGSVSEAARVALSDNGRVILGGDVEARLVYRTLSLTERAALAAHGRLSTLSELRGMISKGDVTTLCEVRAVDDTYPLVGGLQLSPARPLMQALAVQGDGRFGVAMEPALASRLGAVVGDAVTLGQATLTLTALIEKQSDAAATAMALGPRVLLSQAALASTGLLLPGSLVAEVTHLAISDGSDPVVLVDTLQKQFPETGWNLRTVKDAAPALKGIVDVVGQFLTFIGLTALLIGGVGVSNAVTAFIAARGASIATLKCLGASSRLISRIYGLQIGVLAAAGIALGAVAGAGVPRVLALLADRLQVDLPIAIPPGPFPVILLLAATFGGLTALAFTLSPLQRVKTIPAAALYRSQAGGEGQTRFTVPAGLAMLALIALAVLASPHRMVAAWFVVGTVVSLGLFRLVAMALQALAQRLRALPLGGLWRVALSNLYRPGNPARAIILSLGVGTTVLVSIALTEATLSGAINDRLPKIAPAFFFIDIQPKQQAAFGDLVASLPGGSVIQMADMVRGRVVGLKGQKITADTLPSDAQWVVRGDRGLSTAATMPANTQLVAGAWWPSDYRGPPQVSITADLAKGLGLVVGDSVTFNILGREKVATVASIRRVEWASLSMNFAFLLSPGVIDSAPRTILATVALPRGGEAEAQRRITSQLPNVSAINVRETLAAVANLLAAAGHAVEASAAVTLTAGVLVLVASIAAGQRRRVTEAVILQILGVRRRHIMAMQVIEFALLGVAAGSVAATVGTLSAWAMTTHIFRLPWHFELLPVLVTVTAAASLAGLAGAAATWQALSIKPAQRLREDDMAAT